MFVHAARQFTAHGVACLRFDLRGRGESGGRPEATDLDGMIDDTLAAVDLLRTRSDAPRLYVLGICSGGNVALGAASLHEQIDGLLLWSTPLFAPFKTAGTEAVRRARLLGEYCGKLFRRETYAKLFGGNLRWRIIGRNVLGRPRPPAAQRNPKDSRRHVMSDLHGYRGPMLFVYGSRDADAAGAPEFFRRYCAEACIPAEFHTIDGANHSYYARAWEAEVIRLSNAWLAKRCQ